jgi:hypothetical protein
MPKKSRDPWTEEKAVRDLEFDAEIAAATVDAWSDEELIEQVARVAFGLRRRALRGARSGGRLAGQEVGLEHASRVFQWVAHALATRDERTLGKLGALAREAPTGTILHFRSQSDCFNWLAERCVRVLGQRPPRLSLADRTAHAERSAAELSDGFPFWLSWCVALLEGRPQNEVGVPRAELVDGLRTAFIGTLMEATAAEWESGETTRRIVRAGTRALGVSEQIVKGAFDVQKKADRRRRRRASPNE